MSRHRRLQVKVRKSGWRTARQRCNQESRRVRRALREMTAVLKASQR